MSRTHTLTAILPCNDLDASAAFYRKLGFTQISDYGNYRILADGKGGELHLNKTATGWLAPGHNPFGIYLYTENVDALAASLGDDVLKISLGQCTNLPVPIPTERLFVSVGLHIYEQNKSLYRKCQPLHRVRIEQGRSVIASPKRLNRGTSFGDPSTSESPKSF